METNKFFVYGTLKANGRFGKSFESVRVSVEPAKIFGFDMYNVGDRMTFPAAVPGKGIIIGEVHTFPEEHMVEILNRFDRIEGFDPNNHRDSLYIRKVTQVILTDSNTTEDVYFYQFNIPIRPSFTKVESGIWNVNK